MAESVVIDSYSVTSERLPSLRFVLRRLPNQEQQSRILQQAVEIREYAPGGVAVAMRHEWRDVPLVTEE